MRILFALFRGFGGRQRTLELSLGAKFNGQVFKMERRLFCWKNLPKNNRFILARSTLSDLLIYSLSLFLIPSSIVKRLESLHYCFLLRRCYYLVAWDVLKRPFALGGLGIRYIMVVMKALLTKWLLKLMYCGTVCGEVWLLANMDWKIGVGRWLRVYKVWYY